uniref:La-related protein 1B n=1 Tax=Noccaea caerulescens TaxID=107243 RepID=A0A1J3J7U5_NOCCA
MATTTESSAGANSASRYSTDSRSRRDSSPWMAPTSDAIHDHDHPAPSISLDDRGKDTSDYDNADKKPVWNKPSTSSADVGPVMGAESWPALSLSASTKSPSSDGSSPMPPPQAAGTCLISTSKSDTNANANANANAGSSAVAATSSENHHVNGQRKPIRRNNTTSSSSSNPPNAAPLNTRDQNHSQRGGSYASGTSTHFRNPNRNRNGSSYPRGDNRRGYDHGNQTGFSHRNHNGRDMHVQPQRGFGMMRPQMMMGPPSFPANTAQYMAAPQIGSYGGPMLYSDFSPHMVMPHPPPESMALVGHFTPLPMYFSSADAGLYHKILTQVEYYFSADNLSKDGYLRRQMNDEGWVSVTVIAGFRKLTELTNNIQTILDALRSSEVVEIKGEALRRRGDWDKYLLPNEPSRSGPVAAANKNASLESQVESMTLSERRRYGELKRWE